MNCLIKPINSTQITDFEIVNDLINQVFYSKVISKEKILLNIKELEKMRK